MVPHLNSVGDKAYANWVLFASVKNFMFRFFFQILNSNGRLKSVTLLCVRDRTHDGVRDFGNSLVFSVELPQLQESDLAGESII